MTRATLRCMKNLRIALLLLAVLLPSMAALAQSSTPPERPSPQVTQAHCQYTPNDPACQHARQTNPGPGQCRPPSPCPIRCCRYGYPPPRPPFLWEPGNGTHATAGALVGLGLGAALGASKDGNADSRLAGALVIGGLGALIGAAVGHGIPARPSHRHHPAWEGPDENASAARPNPPSRAESRRKTASADQPSGP